MIIIITLFRNYVCAETQATGGITVMSKISIPITKVVVYYHYDINEDILLIVHASAFL